MSTDAEIAALFHKAREVEYETVVNGCREILRHLKADSVTGFDALTIRGVTGGG